MALLEKDRDLEFPHIFIIEASAGSGKTHALTQRFVQFLLSEAIPNSDLSNILAITFTNNAAREMKERILNWLKNLALGLDREVLRQTLELVSVPEDRIPSLADRVIDRILQDYTDFHVQTIDSFMRRIFSASAIELGFPPEVEIQTTYEDLVEYTLSLMLREVGTGGNRELTRTFEEFLEGLESPGKKYKWNPYYEMKKEINSLLEEESKRVKEVRFPEAPGESFLTETFDELHRTMESLAERGEGCLERSRSFEAIERAIAKRDISYILHRSASGSFPLRKASEKKDCKELRNDLLQEWVKFFEGIKEKLAFYLATTRLRGFAALYPAFKDELDRTKRRRGIIHISDLNKKLSDYIRESTVPEIYFRLGDELYHFLMDEFQDTDAVQWENLKPLIGEALSKRGSFFAVGDLKQAIYMFKNADYRIMKKLVESAGDAEKIDPEFLSAAGNIKIVRLEKNYRSGERILDFVKHTFRERLGDLLGDSREKFDRTGLTVFTQEAHDPLKGKGYVRTLRIYKERGSEEDPEREELIKIVRDVLKRYNPGDVAILARKKEEVEKIIGWLIEEGINAASYSTLDVRKRRIINEIVGLLRFLDSPIDELSFSNFLLGRIMGRVLENSDLGITTEDLRQFIFRNKRDRTGRPIYTALREDSALSPLWKRYFEELYRRVGYLPLYDLLLQIYRTFGIIENFPDEAGFLSRLLESVNQLEAHGMNSIKDFLELFERGSEELFEICLPEFLNAVRVMTFHKSKGLGFPVVINLLYEPRDRWNSKLFVEVGDGMTLYYITSKIIPHFRAITEAALEEKLRDKIQNLNVLYVVTTRAKNELYNIVVCSKENCEEAPSSWDTPERPGEIKPLDLFESATYGEIQPVNVSPEEIPAPTDLKLWEKTPPFAEKTAGGQEWTRFRVQETLRGEFIHDVLRRIKFLKEIDPLRIRDAVEAAARRTRIAEDLDAVTEKLVEFLGLPEVQRWFVPEEGRRVLNEVEVIDEKGNTHRIDRLVIDRDRVTVIDYKTGEDQPREYVKQVKRYMELVGRMFPGRKISGYLAYFDLQKVEEVTP